MAGSQLSADVSLRGFLTGLADAGQGAVSAAAATGAMGTSLLLKVAALPTSRSDFVEERMTLLRAAASLSDVREQLMELIETETGTKIFAAQNMPQDTTIERSNRHAAMQRALRAAAAVPLDIIRLCALALDHAQTIAAVSRRAASSDVKLAITLLHLGLNGARASLEAKLTSLTDIVYTKTVVDEIAKLSNKAANAVHAAELIVEVPPA